MVCDWLPPAFGAVGQYALARARDLAASGRTVTLIGLGAKSSEVEEPIAGGALRIIRIGRPPSDKRKLPRRVQWLIGTLAALFSALTTAARNENAAEIRVTGSPPFLSYMVLVWAWFAGRRLDVTYRITDFYPETVIATGKAPWLKPTLPFFHALRGLAGHIEAISECQRVRLRQAGIKADRIEIVRDACPVSFAMSSPCARPFSKGDVVMLYSGNLGVAHDWSTFAEAYRRHVQAGPNRVRLWLNATGAAVPALVAYCRKHELPIHCSAPVDLDELAGVLLAADAHLILLGDPFWGFVVPSKIYACMESGRPCLYVGPEQSDMHALLAQHARNISIRNGDISGAERALAKLAPRDAD